MIASISTRYSLLISICCLLLPPYLALAEEKSQEQPLLTNTRQLIFEGRRSGEGYFSADGSKMIFQSEREPDNPFYQIYLMDLETGDVERISTGSGKTTCAWIHPEGDRVLFASTRDDPEAQAKQREELDKRAAGQGRRYSWSFDEHYDIYQTVPGSGQFSRLTDAPGYDAEGSWSPDGKLIVFASNRHAYQQALDAETRGLFERDPSVLMDIYLMNADGGQVRRLTDAPGYDGGPFFSPDGTRIVWRRFAPNGKVAEVWTMNTDGSDPRQITRLGVMSWAPFYHPSGDYIIFTNNAQGYRNFELYIVDSQGQGEPVRVTYTDGFDGLPVFTPDGQRLSWASSRTPERKAQIFMADWNDGEARRLLGLKESGGTEAAAASPEPRPPDLDRTQGAITPDDLRLHVNYLASEALAGRLTGSAGERLATRYVADVFKALGLEPAGDDGGFFQTFEFTAGVSLAAGNRLTVHSEEGSRDFSVDESWRPLAFSGNGAVDSAEIVFAGYGIVTPATDDAPPYDAYAELDVSDRWVMVLRYLPENITPQRRLELSRYADLRYKAMLARDKGARGLIVVSGPGSGVKQQLVKLSFDTALGGTSMATLSVTDALASELLAASGKDLKALQASLDGGEAIKGFVLSGIRLDAHIALEQERRSGRSVLARLPAASTATLEPVMIGAHVDHLGLGDSSGSLATGDEKGQVHPGADDNASGVAALLEIAQYLATQVGSGKLELKRDVIFAAWSGEELGLLGSSHYAKHLGEDTGTAGEKRLPIAAYLNMDMVGRLDQRLYLQGVGSSTRWPGEIERRNAPVGLSITLQQDSYLPTDATSFYLQGVPVLNAFTGPHPDYNTPRDTPARINYDGTARIALLMALLTRSVALNTQAPDYVAMEKPAGTPTRRNLQAYLGTIPEYGESDQPGVKLNGVAEAGPAARAGLRSGDVIVELAGKTIENIYDFTYALNALKVGSAVEIVVQRQGEPLILSVTPARRE